MSQLVAPKIKSCPLHFDPLSLTRSLAPRALVPAGVPVELHAVLVTTAAAAAAAAAALGPSPFLPAGPPSFLGPARAVPLSELGSSQAASAAAFFLG